MGRELKRVPMDFAQPMGKVWPGYLSNCEGEDPRCIAAHQAFVKEHPTRHDGTPWAAEDANECQGYCKEDPPTGDGFQLWETTSEGSPASPVFATLDELCAWCETNATTFASFTAPAEDWKRMLGGGLVHHRQGNMVFF